MPTRIGWSDPHLRGVKRQISQHEKRTVPTTVGRALVMPGEPPSRESEIGEVEELRQIGYDPMYIFGVEREEELAVDLDKYYFDTCHIHLEEAGEFLGKAQLPFSYIHLDFTSQLKQDEVEAIQAMMGKVDRTARIRVSLVATRRQEHQIEYEAMLRRTILGNLCRQMHAIDDDRQDRFPNMWEKFSTSTDTTQLVVAIMLMNFFFGIDAMRYADLCAVEENVDPPKIRGVHRLTNINRFLYAEPGGHHQMFTVWCDLAPFQLSSVPSDAGWVPNEVANVLSSALGDIPTFIPELYMEAR